MDEKDRMEQKKMIDKELIKLLGSNRKYIVYAVLFMLGGLLANLGITMCICTSIQLTLDAAELSSYAWVALAGAAAILMRYLCTRCTASFKDRIGCEAKRELRARTYNKIVRLGMKSTDEMSMAGLTQVSMEGIEQLDLYFSSYIPQFFYAMLAPVLLFLVSVRQDVKVAAVLLGCVPLIPVSIIAVSKWAKKIFAKYWDKYTSMGDYFLDSVQGLKELKIFKADARQHERMNQRAEEFRVITMKVLTMQLASTTIMDLVAYGGAGLGIAFTVLDLSKGKLSVTAALFLMLVAVDFFLPLRAFGSAFHVAMNGVSAGKKIIRLLDMPEPQWGENKMSGRDVVLKDVTFSYDGSRDVLKNISMTFPAKGMSAIVGESGCGKSTIVGIVDGNYLPQKGSVRIGGTLLNHLSRTDFYAHIAVVSYNTYIFNDTVRNNFLLADPKASEGQMKEALERVNLWAFIQENGGLDKTISEDAVNISGGQKQRLALAVNLAADKDIYIFDEATSNIDIESETIIMKNIKVLSKTKNVIVISHRLENVVPADQIYYLEKGEVKECDSHASLMETNGGYAKLYRRQKQLEQGYAEVRI
ncbi:MAG: ABC transporter ATP-binding protein/permease [Eubacteriales bacterium]|nr:ABC transporter ATP-binding protein/permease [Eubacteriales bacterium]